MFLQIRQISLNEQGLFVYFSPCPRSDRLAVAAHSPALSRNLRHSRFDVRWPSNVRSCQTDQLRVAGTPPTLRLYRDRVGGNFSDKRNFRPLTPPCVPFGTRRFNQLNNKHALRRSSLPWRLIRIGLVSLLLQPCSSLRLGIHKRCAPHSTLLTRRISC